MTPIETALAAHKCSGLLTLLPVIAGLAGLAAILVAVRLHGLWYDELFTLYVTRPGLDLTYALREYWLQDNHPPLFYFLSWSTNFLGDAVEPRRMVNVAVYLGAALVLIHVWRSRIVDKISFIFFVFGMLASVIFAGIAAELRSYFMSLVLPGLLSLLLAGLLNRPENSNLRERKLHLILIGFVCLIAVNIHFVTTIVSCAILLAFFIRAMLAKDFHALRWIFILGAASLAPFAVFTGLAFTNIESNTRSFWASPGVMAGLRTVIETALQSARDIWPLILLALPGIAGVAMRIVRKKRLDDRDANIVTTMGVLAIFMIALFAIHSVRSIIVDYYLVGLIGPATLFFALAAARTVDRLPLPAAGVGLGVMAIWSLAALAINTSNSLGWPNSYAPNADFISATVKKCPQTIVHRDIYPQRHLTALPPDENRIVSLASYQVLAELYGFKVAPWSSREMARDCPTLFWSNYDNERDPVDAVLRRLRGMGFPVTHLSQVPLGSGVVHVSPPIE